MRKMLVAVPIVALALASSTACATKKYVNTRTGEVNDKVDTLSKTVEENQERTRQNETRIGEVDQRAAEANTRAEAAGRSADEARSAAVVAGQRAEAVDQASRRLIYEMVLSEDQGNFQFGKADLPDEAKMELDKVVAQMKADPRSYFIEIEGHTDAVGSPSYNERLGLERAESVKRYFYEQHQVPLHKMNVISYGETRPVAGNKTRDERAQNRRVIVKVLA
jgi:outer membrane protein OmpA-like peptidoglycan-associated protein